MATSNRMTQDSQPNWFYIGIFCIVVAFVFFQPFLAPIALSAVFAYLLFPMYNWLRKRMKDKVAASLTMVSSILIFLLPIIFIIVLAVQQAFNLAETVSNLEYKPGSSLYVSIHAVGDTVGTILPPDAADGAERSLREFIQQTIPFIISQSIKIIAAIAASAPQLITSAIIYGFTFNILLVYHKQIKHFLITASPFSEEDSGKYMYRAGLMVSASLKGQFIISFVTAVSSAFLLFLLGLQPYFLPLTILFTILGMVPLGSGIVVVPISLFAMVSGNFWPGLWVFLIYSFVICNFDNVMRPRLVPKDSGMIQALAIIATFSGIYYFGIMGIVYGPLIVIGLMTTAQIYLNHKQRQT